jgi:hypothetical protein
LPVALYAERHKIFLVNGLTCFIIIEVIL